MSVTPTPPQLSENIFRSVILHQDFIFGRMKDILYSVLVRLSLFIFNTINLSPCVVLIPFLDRSLVINVLSIYGEIKRIIFDDSNLCNGVTFFFFFFDNRYWIRWGDNEQLSVFNLKKDYSSCKLIVLLNIH